MTVQLQQNRALAQLAINLMPLMDVLFNLLAFFLVVAHFAEADRELAVVLPTASQAMPLVAEPKELFVGIDREGRFHVDGKVLTEDELEIALRQAAADNPVNQSVIIRADKDVPLQFAVTVMDLCNRAGIGDYTITTAGDVR